VAVQGDELMETQNRLSEQTLVLGWDGTSVIGIREGGRGEWNFYSWTELNAVERQEVAKRFEDWFGVADFWPDKTIANRWCT
jgi:hypothetical protein